MNRPIIPFQVNVWSFIIALVLMMMVLRLAYFVINWLLPRLRQWKRNRSLLRSQKPNEVGKLPSTGQLENGTGSTSVEVDSARGFPWSSIRVGHLRSRIPWVSRKGEQAESIEMGSV